MTDPFDIDEAYVARLVAYDNALEHGQVAVDSPQGAPPQDDAGRDMALLRLLQRLRPSGQTLRRTIILEPSTDIETLATSKPSLSLDRFEVRREVGSGAFGTVYEAFDTRLHREVALKVPKPEVVLTPQLRKRFFREAHAAAALDHPNLVPIYDAEFEGPVCFIASAYCSGPTLSQWLARRKEVADWREAVALMIPLTRAVHHAHERGIIHRDLKPSNILLAPLKQSHVTETLTEDSERATLLSDCTPKITDFGLAKFLETGCPDLTAVHAVVGTRGYMAPEQAWGRGKEAGTAADIYSLGAILYEMLTGRTPLEAETEPNGFEASRSWNPPSPRRWQRSIPRPLEWIVLKCLEREPTRRHRTAADLADELNRVLEGERVRTRPKSTFIRTWNFIRRHGSLIATAVLATCLAVTILVLRNPPGSPESIDQVLHAFSLELDRGKPVTLVGETGLPRWYRIVTPDKRLSVSCLDGEAMQLNSSSLIFMLELLPDTRCDYYRLRADVAHEGLADAISADEQAGLYFGHQSRGPAEGIVYHTLSFAERGRLAGGLFSNICRYRPAGINMSSILNCASDGPKPFPILPAGVAGTWRRIVVDVTEAGIDCFFDDLSEPAIRQPYADLDLKLVSLSKGHVPTNLPEAVPGFRYAQRGALGIYLRGAARFRNIVLEPLLTRTEKKGSYDHGNDH